MHGKPKQRAVNAFDKKKEKKRKAVAISRCQTDISDKTE